MIKISDRYKEILFFGLALAVFVAGYLFIKDTPPKIDEQIHQLQILVIRDNHDFFPEGGVMMPGYHWSLAFLSGIIQNEEGYAVRFLTTILSFFCLAAFFQLTKKVEKDSAVQKGIYFLLFPILLPYFSLIYTDLYSMLYVFLSLLFAWDRRLWLAGFFGILSLLVRQNNIIWLGFIAAGVYLEDYYPQWQWRDVKQWIGKFAFFILAAALTIAYAIWNKGFAYGDREHHPLSFTVENVFFSFFLFFFLFLPYHLSNAKKIAAYLGIHKIMLAVLSGLFLVYFFGFRASHFYNNPKIFGYFLHNYLLKIITANDVAKAISFLPIAYAILSLCVTPLIRRSFYLLYPFAVLFLIPLPLIEHRYYFIPYALFLLFKKEKDPPLIAGLTMAMYVVVVIFLMQGLVAGSFFL